MADVDGVKTSAEIEAPKQQPRPRGFAAMSPEKVAEIASRGGKAAHAAGTAHKFDSAEAKEAGKKGGIAPHASRGMQKKNSTSPVE